MTSQPTNFSQHRGGSPSTKAARATFAKNTINNVIPHILQNNTRARLGNESTEKIYYSPSMLKIKAVSHSKAGPKEDIPGERKTVGSSSNSNSNANKGKITGFFKPLPKVQKNKDGESATSSHIYPQKIIDQAIASDITSAISSTNIDDEETTSPRRKDQTDAPYTSSSPSLPKAQPKISVVQSDTLNAARGFADSTSKNRRIAVLNMASFLRPGGGVLNGAIAQEESLCLRSTLYTALDERFYRLPRFGGLFTEDILVFRDSHNNDLPKADCYFVDVISVAALKNPDLIKTPEGKQVYEFEEDKEEMMSKIKLILLTALQKKTTHLILGALGCGAYYNPPEEVAKMFRRVMMGDKRGRGAMDLSGIEEIVFAIFDDGVNLRVFRDVFEGGSGSGGGKGDVGGNEKEDEKEDEKEEKGKGKDVEMGGMN